ncbi:cob(I)yrinic acid a,c-diamide adenosyltransferase [Anaerobranca gottschalkii]|uniref:Cob(I)yrinic acid a,c-diamide adenosyltransferase n=1 Tax=Anaerobranca gottschalkii DSM 13577 TaxID=1120990 RepID=A0A1I0A268_9FIRM|nr:cob(I)yrinic acid a,c-diamide adenosyltransferase [Anaerobranca gottschalkii]SES88035.1 cob(I)yrinic acid a,c-diamide adenosyltransferase [Anaerobranca gottschalkii DSM 13577]
MEKRFVQVYTGDGKGKTTAALGLALRAAGWGYKILFVQFLKGQHSGEVESIKFLKNIELLKIGAIDKFTWQLTEEEYKAVYDKVQREWSNLIKTLKNSNYDIIVLDEILGTIKSGLVTEEQVCSLIDENRDKVEIVLTGRNLTENLKDKADLLTEMKNVRHYYQKGVKNRKGIEK